MINTNISDIKNYIGVWDTVRNSPKGLELLRSGFAFTITKDDYSNWQEMEPKPDIIHVYLALNASSQLMFCLVDNITDAKGGKDEGAYKLGVNVFLKNFNNSLINSEPNGNEKIPDVVFSANSGVSEGAVLRKIMTWYLYGQQWFEAQKSITNLNNDTPVSEAGVVRVFSVPFSDLRSVFSKTVDSNITEAFVFFGIHQEIDPETGLKNYIELVLCNHILDISKTQSILEVFEDVSKPKPPFSGLEGYNLF